MINIINNFEKPQRYIGQEINSIKKKHAKTKFLLAYPDVYEIGISHFGSRILYESINYLSSFLIERAYMPWLDLYYYMKKENIALRSIESNKLFSDFDAIGFSSSTELSYTNILAMIDLAGFNVLKEKRLDTDPLIILGGIASFNPSPLIDFIDVFVIGEADFLIQEILNVLSLSKDKKDRLINLSKLEGIYIPSLNYNKKVKKVFLKDLNSFPLIKHPLIPLSDSVHDRITYEIQRGCNRGCRFCQAGMIYRPVRQRSFDTIVNSIQEDLKLSGYRDIGFLSLNACDYLPLELIIEYIDNNFKGQGVSVSLPSLRIESINERFLNILSSLPKGGFTIAPEVASSKLKKVVNKDISENEIIETVKLVSKLGWNSIKAYFMLGLPKEDASDLDAIIDLSYKMLNSLSSYRQSITINLSNFIPKTHTPFQWCKQDTHVETQKKLDFFIKNLKNKRISLKWTDAKVSEIEGLLSRADENIGPVLYDLYKAGEVFTSWGKIDYDLWLTTLKKHKIDINEYLDTRPFTTLPWDNIDTRVSKDYLIKEYNNSLNAVLTKDCILNACTKCGVCDLNTYNIIEKDFNSNFNTNKINIKTENLIKQKTRFRYTKTSSLRFLSHFEIMNIIEKASIRADLAVLVSSGFKPGFKISYGPPLSYAVSSYAELCDFSFYKNYELTYLLNTINNELPDGLEFKSADNLAFNSKSINSSIEKLYYKIDYDSLKTFNLDLNNFNLINNKFVYKDLFIIKKEKKVYINNFIDSLELKDDNFLHFTINYIDGKSLKLIDFLSLMYKDLEYNKLNIIKRGIKVDGYYYGD